MSHSRFAIIENEVVVNCIAADDDFVAEFYPTAVEIDDVVPEPCPGWWYKNGQFICPPQPEPEPEEVVDPVA
jgi:hypothetical protein